MVFGLIRNMEGYFSEQDQYSALCEYGVEHIRQEYQEDGTFPFLLKDLQAGDELVVAKFLVLNDTNIFRLIETLQELEKKNVKLTILNKD